MSTRLLNWLRRSAGFSTSQRLDPHIPPNLKFATSREYWQDRYSQGGTSGAGSYAHLAHFKAEVLNKFVRENSILTVIEFGCGDGNQLTLAEYPRYTGLDVARAAIKRCIDQFSGDSRKSFFIYDSECFLDHAGIFRAELALSLDVVFHLVEDDVYERYLDDLFASAARFVVIYSSDYEAPIDVSHVRHRRFSDDVKARFREWEELARIPNRYPQDSFAEFVVFSKKDQPKHGG